MVKWLWILPLTTLFISVYGAPKAYYASPTLSGKELDRGEKGREFTLHDDSGKPVPVVSLTGGDGMRYWYRRVFTEVCLTGECRPVDVGLYWQFTGKYLGIEVYREPLTKTDHSDFSPLDYSQLESILRNEWSDLREYSAEELVEPSASADDRVDGITGATRKVIGDAAVKDAVYTTYTIWHLIHVGEPEQLELLALGEMTEQPAMAHILLASADAGSRDFVLRGVVDGYLLPDSAIESTIFEGLLADDQRFRGLSIQALAKLDVSERRVQDNLAEVYPGLDAGEKIRLLSALEPADKLSPVMQARLFSEFKKDTPPWVLLKILQVFQKIPAELAADQRQFLENFKTDHRALAEALDNFRN